MALSIVTLEELQAGVHYGNDPARAKEGLDNFLSTAKVPPITEEICDHVRVDLTVATEGQGNDGGGGAEGERNGKRI